jgi:RpiR family transcriptional regulator, carbohydrate utilization regulator
VEPDLLLVIEQGMPSLSRAERRVARVVLDAPVQVTRDSLAHLAEQAGVSQPTVVRFCRAIGCTGYRDFRVRLAQSLGRRPAFARSPVVADDAADVYPRKLVDNALDALLKTRDALDGAAVEQAVDVLVRAADGGRIAFFGLGTSGTIASDAVQRFLLLVAPCAAYTDVATQGMSAASLGPDDAVVAVSRTGSNAALNWSVSLARQAGAAVIAIAPLASPLAALASVALAADVVESPGAYTPSPARLVQALLVDVLAVGVALRNGRRAHLRVDTMRRVLHDARHLGGEMLAAPG